MWDGACGSHRQLMLNVWYCRCNAKSCYLLSFKVHLLKLISRRYKVSIGFQPIFVTETIESSYEKFFLAKRVLRTFIIGCIFDNNFGWCSCLWEEIFFKLESAHYKSTRENKLWRKKVQGTCHDRRIWMIFSQLMKSSPAHFACQQCFGVNITFQACTES